MASMTGAIVAWRYGKATIWRERERRERKQYSDRERERREKKINYTGYYYKHVLHEFYMKTHVTL